MPTLREIFSNTADAIRSKTGKSESIYPADMASEIEGISSGGGYKLEKMPSGAVSSFNDGTDLPLNKLKVSIEPVQSGSGDPSPSNVRPISGWDECKVTRTGKNLCNNSTNIEGFYDNAGFFFNDKTKRSSQPIKVNPLTTYSGSIFDTDTNDRANNVVYTEWDKNGDFIQQMATTSITTSANTAYIRIRNYEAQASLVQSNHYAYQLEESNESTTYEPYAGTTYTIPFTDSQGNPITVYGGKLDVVSGVLTVDKGYIASYNGETLPSTWISDRDVYVEGTSPTTGAQVVYELATPITYQLTPTAVKSLLGTNNIWADTGDIINGEYFKGAESSGSGIIYYIKNIRIDCEVI